MKKEAMLYKRVEDEKVVCDLCEHRCRIHPGNYGICRVRRNDGGRLMTEVYGDVIAAHVDPIEKKPLYHFLPGSLSFSMATVGCNFRCSFCQNWQISQADTADDLGFRTRPYSPREIVTAAQESGCRSIAYTYTEPTIFFEYAYDTARLATEQNMGNVFVTNGFMTPEAIRTIEPYLDAANVDLKSFRDAFYREICKARLEPVLDSIRLMHELGIWVEVTTLVVPGQNDSDEELASIARFLTEVDTGIPWHISRYHPDYEYDHAPATPEETLRKAARIGREAGLRYVYIGNLPGISDTTSCPNCGETLIRRAGFATASDTTHHGRCPSCGSSVAGVFSLPKEKP